MHEEFARKLLAKRDLLAAEMTDTAEERKAFLWFFTLGLEVALRMSDDATMVAMIQAAIDMARSERIDVN